MPTIGEVVDLLESELFVGRERELAIFQQWLTARTDRPEILNVSGRGGIGKSALLRAFARTARQQGKQAILADSRDFPHTPEGLLGALADGWQGDVLNRLNETGPLILIDTFEEAGELTRYLQEQFLPRLSETVKVVIAGRYPLGQLWRESSPWQRIVRPVAIGSFSSSDSREYLRRRDLSEASLIEQITQATGGNPLALTLAADMALQLGTRDFNAAPEWHMVVRSLVNQLLRDVAHPQLRELLESCAVVRRFDEATLAAISGREDIGTAFDQLCQLSVVRPAEHGLMLHDDLRRALAEDLRWRNAERYNALRLRALAYYRQRSRWAPAAERERLLMERFYLWENGFIQALLFADYEPGQVWVEPGRYEDHEAILRFWTREAAAVYAKELGFESPGDMPAEARQEVGFEIPADVSAEARGRGQIFLREALRYADTRVNVVRDTDGRLVGFSMALPLCQESLRLFDLHPELGLVLHAYYSPQQLAALPATARETDAFYVFLVAWGEVLPEAVRAATLRDLFGLLAHGGLYLATMTTPDFKALVEAWGFERVPGASRWFVPGKLTMDGYVLDLTRIGVERWIEALLSGRRPTPATDSVVLERQLKAVLLCWQDDAPLATSTLAETLALPVGGAEAERAAALRAKITGALAGARENATSAEAETLGAIDLAYIQRGISHDWAAQQLAVSRSTFYRLLRQGIRLLSQQLGRTY